MSGQDLAELRTGKTRRNRAKVERELTAERVQAQAQRRRTASRIQKRAETSRFVHRLSAIVRRVAPIVLVVAVTLGATGGAVYWYTHPQLSVADVREGVRPVTVKVERRLGAPVELRSIVQAGAEYVVEYRVPKGELGFSGRKALRDCSASANIRKTQRLPISRYTIHVGACRYSKRVYD